jgi:carbonic anhydrase/acetyltransferase-like protein (isoleucine patch superfamily)
VSAPLVFPVLGKAPRIDRAAFVAPNAVVCGEVEIGPGASVWYGCVLRGDVNSIRVGADANIQDGTVVHVTRKRHGTEIGAGVTIGHMALVHGCTLEDFAFIGMGATVMDGCVVETDAMLAAGALLTPGKRVKRGELWAGRPARFLRPLEADEIAYIRDTAGHYARLGAEHAAALTARA